MNKLLDYCNTAYQRAVVEAYEKYGSANRVARELGKDVGSIGRIIRNIKGRASKQDLTQHQGQVPEGYEVSGTSTLVDSEGNIRLQWQKTNIDLERQYELAQEALASLSESLPKYKKVKPDKIQRNSDLVNVYVLTDYHLGMLAWGEETGADWDTDLAEKTMVAWFEKAIESSPKADTCVFAQLGDLLHWDGMDAVTPASKHLLDADTRFQRLVRVAIRVVRQVIEMLRKKYQNVHVLMADANHDPAAGVWLREWLSSVYQNEPRVTVDVNPDTYYCYEHGSTALFFHHGHKRRVANIDTVFAAKFREVFGRTKHAFAHMGHLHSVDVKETNLMLVEQHRTLAAPDAYASRGGWCSGRDAKVITYHKEYGEVQRVVINFDMINHS